jgi:L-cysteate sulfo-lyase
VRLGVTITDLDVEVVAGYAGPAYGVPHAATIEAIKLAGRLEALPVDPVYSGKGLAGLIAMVQGGRWSADQDVIFVHTGGVTGVVRLSERFANLVWAMKHDACVPNTL